MLDASSARRSQLFISGIAALIGATLIGTFVFEQKVQHTAALAKAESDLSGTANVLAEHLARTLDAAKQQLKSVGDVRGHARAQNYSPSQAHVHLKAVHGGSPVFHSLVWVDDQGARIASSFFEHPPALSIKDAKHFTAPRDHAAYADRLYVSAPRFAKLLDAWILVLTLRLEDEAGRFVGVAAGTTDLSYFGDVYRSARIGASGTVQLVGEGGVVLTQEPFDETALGAALPDMEGKLVQRADVSGSALDVVVSVSRSEALSDFWAQFFVSLAMLSLSLVVLFGAMILLLRHSDRRFAAERRLHASHDQFRDFAAASGDWFWELGPDLRFVWVSDTAEAMTGKPADWYIGKPARDMIAAEHVDDAWLEAWRAVEQRRPFRDLEFPGVGPQRDRRFAVSGVPLIDATGQFIGYRGNARDITELRTAELRLEEAVHAFPGRFMIYDAEERLVFANFGQSTPIKAVASHLHMGEKFEPMCRRLVDAGLIEDAEDDPDAWLAERLASFRDPQDSFLMRINGRVIEVIERKTHDGGVISLRFDVTERVQAVAALDEARADADRASQAKSEFLASMSHELRTPLNAILGFGQMLQLGKPRPLPSDQQEYADDIVRSGRHLLNLVSEVLDLAGVESGHLKLSIERVDMLAAANAAVRTMQAVADQAGVTLHMSPELNVLDVRADMQRLRQVLLNLLSNAIKYNRRGGSVRVHAYDEGDRVILEVQDTGMGIAPEYVDQVFDPFDRLGIETTEIEGTGVGLSLCKRLVEAMDGQIEFTSTVGMGTTFRVALTAEAKSEQAPLLAEGAGVGPIAATGGYSLLYVEDNPASLRLMEHLVGTLPDVRLISAPSGPLGLDMAIAKRPDIIVLDLNLPGLSGFDVLKRLKSHPDTWNIPVIALTAAAMPRDVQRGMSAGFYRYITKPLDVNAFLATIEDALTERHVEPDADAQVDTNERDESLGS